MNKEDIGLAEAIQEGETGGFTDTDEFLRSISI
jgi:hypothetical protein